MSRNVHNPAVSAAKQWTGIDTQIYETYFDIYVQSYGSVSTTARHSFAMTARIAKVLDHT